MNFISLLLTFLVLMLSINPCCTISDECHEIAENEMESKNHEHEDNNSQLPCSPFYSCGNCAGVIIKDQRLWDFSPLNQHTIPKSEFFLDYVSEGFRIIPLKPPRYI